jgi:hypothetical protein
MVITPAKQAEDRDRRMRPKFGVPKRMFGDHGVLAVFQRLSGPNLLGLTLRAEVD